MKKANDHCNQLTQLDYCLNVSSLKKSQWRERKVKGIIIQEIVGF